MGCSTMISLSVFALVLCFFSPVLITVTAARSNTRTTFVPRTRPIVPDTDSDGVPDHLERSLKGVDKEVDTDGDGIPDHLDPDDDDDGIPDGLDSDKNGDGIPDFKQDGDGDGIPDYLDLDDDGDGISDKKDKVDSDEDGIPDDVDDDDDNDGIAGEALALDFCGSSLYLVYPVLSKLL